MSTNQQQLEIQEISTKLPPSPLGGVLGFLRELNRAVQAEDDEADFNWERIGRIMRDNDEVLRRLAQ